MPIISKTQGKKLEQEISLAQRIKPGRKMKWSDVDISFGPRDHPKTELSNRNLPFVVKLPIRLYKVAKTLIDNGVSLNFMMRKNLHRDEPQSERLDPHIGYVSRGHHRAVAYSHWTHRPGGVIWNRGQQAQGDTDVRGSLLQYRVQLHPQEAFPLEVYDVHPHCLCHDEDAWHQRCYHHQGQPV
jgi:hypothetical protein